MRLRRDADVLDPRIEGELAELEVEFGRDLASSRPNVESAADLDAAARRPPRRRLGGGQGRSHLEPFRGAASPRS